MKQIAMKHSAMKDRPIHPLVQDARVFKSDPAIQVRQARFRKRCGFDAAGHLCLPRIQRIEALSGRVLRVPWHRQGAAPGPLVQALQVGASPRWPLLPP